MKIRSKRLLLIGILLVTSIFLVNSVSAVGSISSANMTLTFPPASEVINNASVNLVIAIDNLGGIDNYTLANVYAKSTITNATTWINIATNELNDTATNFYM